MAILGDLSLNVSTVLVALVTLAVYALYKTTRKPKGFPPGPFPLPLLGNIPLFMSEKLIGHVFMDLRKKYGDVFSLKFASQDVVVLNTMDVVKEAMQKRGAEFAGRAKAYSMEMFTEGYKDIIFSDYGVQWRFQRKLGHTAIRRFVQKDELEKLVFSVTPNIAKVLDGLGEKPFAPKNTIGQIVFNILATLCFGKQYTFDQPELVRFINLNAETLKSFGNGMLADYFPVFKHLPTLIPAERKLFKLIKEIQKIYYDELALHQQSFDPENVRDFIDSLLLTQKEALEAGEEEAKYLTDTHIAHTVMDIFGAGTDTTIQTLHWAVGLLTEHPDIQEKVAMEIDDIIGRDRLPSLDDRGSLPYTEATLLEINRYGTVAGIGVPHSAMVDTTLAGYNIPKGTTVIINFIGLHFDPEKWDEPEKMKPERFLEENGQLISKLPENYFPFGAGRRVCLGEDFAKKELFLLFTWLFGRYTFYKVPGKESETVLTLNTSSGMVRQLTNEMEVCVKKRY